MLSRRTLSTRMVRPFSLPFLCMSIPELSFFFWFAVTFPTAPHTEVTAKGDIVYSEVVRENVRKLEAYVKEMAQGGKISPSQNVNLYVFRFFFFLLAESL